MTKLEAIYQVLKMVDCPRKVDEICSLLKKAGLWTWAETHPTNIIASCLATGIKNKGRQSRFEKFGANCFGLREHKAPSGKKGYVYILSNPCLPGYVKVGKAESVLERLINLNSAVPRDYKPEYVLVSTSYELAEFQAHASLKAKYHNERDNDEFFRCSVRVARKFLEKVCQSLPPGDNEIYPWDPALEIKFKTLKKGKIQQKYAAVLGTSSLTPVAGSSIRRSGPFGVKMPNGITISKAAVSDTFADVVRQIGVQKVADMFPNLLNHDKSAFPDYASLKSVGGGWYLNVHGSAAELRRKVVSISNALQLGLEIVAV